MGLESQSVINPRHKSCPIKADQPLITWIKFITPSSSFGPSLECPALESAQISWISPLSASLIFLDLALVIGSTGTCNESFNACWFSLIQLHMKRDDWSQATSILELEFLYIYIYRHTHFIFVRTNYLSVSIYYLMQTSIDTLWDPIKNIEIFARES